VLHPASENLQPGGARFDFHAQGAGSFWLEGQQSFWLILERPAVDLCLSDPGYEVDLTVNADVTN
jgi:hypothetical protein